MVVPPQDLNDGIEPMEGLFMRRDLTWSLEFGIEECAPWRLPFAIVVVKFENRFSFFSRFALRVVVFSLSVNSVQRRPILSSGAAF